MYERTTCRFPSPSFECAIAPPPPPPPPPPLYSPQNHKRQTKFQLRGMIPWQDYSLPCYPWQGPQAGDPGIRNNEVQSGALEAGTRERFPSLVRVAAGGTWPFDTAGYGNADGSRWKRGVLTRIPEPWQLSVFVDSPYARRGYLREMVTRVTTLGSIRRAVATRGETRQ